MKIIKRAISFLMVMTFMFTISLNFKNSVISAQERENLEVELRDDKYFYKLLISNEYLNVRVSELKKEGFSIDNTVRSIKGVDFVYYSNFDNSIVGLIQIHKYLNSEIKLNFVNFELETAEFIRENGQKIIMGKDENGQLNKVLYRSMEISYRAPSWCKHVMRFTGVGLGTLYSYIATVIGGPIAGIIVTLVSSYGWDYVVDMCNE